MEVFGPAIGADAARAVVASEILRAEILGAVERNQHMAIQTPEGREPTASFERRENLPEGRKQQLGRHRIEHRAGLVVGRDLVHPEKRLAVGLAPSPFQHLLVGQERRALHEERGERPHPEIAHLKAGILAPPPIRQGRAKGLKARDERFDYHKQRESDAAPQVDDSNCHTPRTLNRTENPALWPK